ncbi:MAG: hypothetical protein AAB426_03435 [Myxococcota bacterium]
MAHQVYIATADSEHSVPLRAALQAAGVAVVNQASLAAVDVPVVAVCTSDPYAHAQPHLSRGVTRLLLFVAGSAPVRRDVVPGATCLAWASAAEAAIATTQWLEAAFVDETEAEELEPLDTDADMVDDAEFLEEAQPVEAQQAPPSLTRAAVDVQQAQISREDQDFITRVFNQVRDVDFREPPPPPPRRDLAGLDKKMHFLRQRVRELERDLARVGFIWDEKSKEVASVDRIIAAKEAERVTAADRYEAIKQQATRASAAHRAENGALQQRGDALAQEVATLTARLAEQTTKAHDEVTTLQQRVEQHQQESLRLATDFRTKLETAQTAFNDLRERSSQRIAELEAGIHQRDEKIAAQDVERRALEERLVAKGREMEVLASERDRTVATLTDELGQVRTDRQERVNEVKEQLKAVQAELASARKEYEHIGAEVSAARERAETELARAQERIRQLETATPAAPAAAASESSSPA